MKTSLTKSSEWQTLHHHQEEMATIHLRDLFEKDPERFSKFSLEAAKIFLDYSKNRITSNTIDLLCQLANACQLEKHIDDLFSGNIVNQSENRPALHTALRDQKKASLLVDQNNIMSAIRAAQEKMAAFTDQILSGAWKGFSGKLITDIVNIGIGGSHLGPALVTEALSHDTKTSLRIHFITTTDCAHISQTLKQLSPQTTLFIVSSKSFSTIETLANAELVKKWFFEQGAPQTAINKHFVAVTAQPQKVQSLGIPSENIFPLWEWIGGRYSLWSSIGLPIMLAIGKEKFFELLGGAHAMDQHFRSTSFSQNMPVILGLLDVWMNNFFDAHARAILPYDQSLQLFPAYLQQLHMESLGKQVTQQGEPLSLATGQVIFGHIGTDAQHSFCQLLHQGNLLIPVDFIVPIKPHHAFKEHHDILLANALGQSQALMIGKTDPNLPSYKTLEGNRPSNMILLPQITPYTLGALLSLYEHRTFVQSVIWGINAFDQWGVEIGKELANNILAELKKEKNLGSTQGLMHYLSLFR